MHRCRPTINEIVCRAALLLGMMSGCVMPPGDNGNANSNTANANVNTNSGGNNNDNNNGSDRPAPAAAVRSSFDSDDEGWRLVNNQIAVPTWEATGGRPGGRIVAQDQSGETAYWAAPAKFLGNVSNAFGAWLTFDLTHSDTGCANAADAIVRLRGAGRELIVDKPYLPTTGWTSYRVALDSTTAWRDATSRELVSDLVIRSVLENLSELLIRAEFRGCGNEFFALDNVTLERGMPTIPVRSGVMISDFNDPQHGWTSGGTAELGASTPLWKDHGGRGGAGGYILAEDRRGDAEMWWDAPAMFLGDLSAGYGGWLSFDLSQSDLGCQRRDGADLMLVGGGLVLTYDFPNNPYRGWTSYRVELDHTAGWRRLEDNELATSDDIMRVLSYLDQLSIRGEFRGCEGEQNGLDRVVLSLTPEPAAALQADLIWNFESSNEGWTALGSAVDAVTPFRSATAGRHGSGMIQITPAGDADWVYWDVPISSGTNLSQALGRFLRYSLAHSDDGCENLGEPEVLLRGGGHWLYADHAYAPYTGWTTYAISFDPLAGWRHVHNNELATAAELMHALTFADQLWIRGEFRGCGGESIAIDKVQIEAGSPPPAPIAANLLSDFLAAGETAGWTAIGTNTLGASIPQWVAAGASGGVGSLQMGDSGNNALYWDAPPAFLGNAGLLLGGSIGYYVSQSDAGCEFDIPELILRGAGHYLIYDVPDVERDPNRPGSNLTPYLAPLNALAGWRDSRTGELATEEQLRQALSNLDQLLIRGEYRGCGGETLGLDRVTMTLP